MADLLIQIFDELSSRFSQRLLTKRIHLRWDTATSLGHIVKGKKELYGIPIYIHGKDDTMSLPWDFESGHPSIKD